MTGGRFTKIKRGAAFLLALLLCAAADPVRATAGEDGGKEACPYAPYTEEEAEALFAGKDWDTVLEEMLQRINPQYFQLGLGYCNTVTGEEHYFNPDEYITGASLYKAPLNMYISEQIALGNMDADLKINGRPYADARAASLTYSNNPDSLAMVTLLGGWPAYRAAIADFVGADPEDGDYLGKGNRFTARQLTGCMTLLAREPERFPEVTECLLESAPDLFLKYADVPYPIAQKYGNINEGGSMLFHVAGIVFTDDPIALVVMTNNLPDQRSLMEEYCRLMCGYTQYHRAERLAQEERERLAREEEDRLAQEEAERLAREEEDRLAQEEAERIAREAAEQAAREEEKQLAAEEAERAARRERVVRAAALTGGTALVAAAGIVSASRRKKKKRR